MKVSAKYLLKLLFSLLIFGLALSQVDWSLVQNTLYAASGLWLSLHLGALIFERIVFTWKWLLLIQVFNRGIGFFRLLANTLIGKLWGTFLPSSLGVDVVRAYYLNRDVNNPTQVTASVLCDKLLALVALLLVAFVGMLQSPEELQHPVFRLTLLVGTLAVISLIFVAVNKGAASIVSRMLGQVRLASLGQFIQRVNAAMQTYSSVPLVLFWSFIASCVMQLVRILSVWLMALALGIDVSFTFLMLIIPLSMLLIMLPISIGGIGLREGILVGIFNLVGLDATDGFSLGLGVTLTDLLLSVAGGVVYLRTPRD
jgi:glycosyltransferase 2 family protein